MNIKAIIERKFDWKRLQSAVALIVIILLSTVVMVWLIMVGYQFADPKMVELNATNNGSQIEIRKERWIPDNWDFEGQILIITLETNGTTRCTWEIAELDTYILRLKEQPKFSHITRGMTDDQPELDQHILVLRFKSVNRGQTPLKLVCRRPQDSEPLKTFFIQVSVR